MTPALRPAAFALTLAACAALLPLAGGCGDGSKRKLGDSCAADADCQSGLCYAEVCLDPAGDEDRDGLLNGVEVGLTTDPLSPDTDGDGVADPVEVGSLAAPGDEDGDGRIDAVESLLADADDDCLPDQRDAEDTKASDDAPALVAAACPAEGVCADAPERRVRCADGTPTCVLAAVPGFEVDETSCDGADNDCNGVVDDTDACVVDEGPCVVGVCDGAGGCVVRAAEGPCDDGDACTAGDRCAHGVCEGGPALDCDDGDPCTDDTCDPQGGCRTQDNTAPCDDGDPCTAGDVCAAGRCAGAPIPVDCGAVGVDDDCDGHTDEDCPGNLRVRSSEYTGGAMEAADGAFGLRARITPTPFHAAGGRSSDGTYLLTPGVPLHLDGAPAETDPNP